MIVNRTDLLVASSTGKSINAQVNIIPSYSSFSKIGNYNLYIPIWCYAVSYCSITISKSDVDLPEGVLSTSNFIQNDKLSLTVEPDTSIYINIYYFICIRLYFKCNKSTNRLSSEYWS